MTKFRAARPEDLDNFLKLVERQDYPPYQLSSVGTEERRRAHLQVYRASWLKDWKREKIEVILAEVDQQIVGYLVLKHGLTESVTHDSQSAIYDCYGDNEDVRRALFEHARVRARKAKSEYLVLQVGSPPNPDIAFYESLGYRAENHRVGCRTRPYQLPAESPFRIRPARQSDLMFIRYLSAVSVKFIVPAGRPIDLPAVTMNFLNAYSDLELEDDPYFLPLILMKGRKEAGYIMFKLPGAEGFPKPVAAFGSGPELGGYVYDLAVRPEYQGHGAALILLQSGENALYERNLPILAGDISASNPRALKTTMKRLSYKIDWSRYGRPVDEPVPAP